MLAGMYQFIFTLQYLCFLWESKLAMFQPHTPLFVWLSGDWPSIRTYVCVYRLQGWGRGDYQKGGRGVSVVSWQVHILYIGHSKNGRLTAVKTGYPLTSITWPYCGLMCQLMEVTWIIWKLSTDQLIVLLDHNQCSISYFVASLRAQENW